MNSLEIITTRDGSNSLINTSLNETYHSIHGARQESLHVFINNGLDFFCERSTVDPIRIFEVGFGTGLNVLLTAQRQNEISRQIHYTSLEAFPLEEKIWKALNYADTVNADTIFQKLHLAPWNKEEIILADFTLLKLNQTLQQASLVSSSFDIIYFDAFAPSKQPELWEISILEKVVASLKPGGVFVTYCAKGQLKRDLKGLGLIVETLPGPPGKKEMVRAVMS